MVFDQATGGGAPAVQLADAGGNPIPASTNTTAYSFGLIATTGSGADTSLSCSGTGETAVTQSTADPTTNATTTYTGYKVSPDSTDGTSASFPQCSVDAPGSGDTLVAVASDNANLFSGNSTSFDVSAGTASQLVFTRQPVGANPNSPLSAEPAVAFEDAAGNVDASQSGGLTVTLVGLDGAGTSATLSCTTNPVTATAGVADFAQSGCSVNQPGTYQLQASAAGFSSVLSNPFVVSSGAAARLVFTNEPGGAALGGSPLPNQPGVTIEDASGNPVSGQVGLTLVDQNGNPVSGTSLTCPNNPGAGVAGVVDFRGCSVDKAGTYKLIATLASDHSITQTSSPAFTVSAGPATQAVFTSTPTSATTGQGFVAQPAVQMEDAGGNPTAASGSVRLLITPGTGAQGAVLSCASNPASLSSAGAAAFSGCRIDRTGTYSLTAVTPIGDATTAQFAVAVGQPVGLVYTSAPTTYRSGGIVPTQPQVEGVDSAGNTVPLADGTVVTLSGATCASNQVAAAGGLAAFSGCIVTATSAVTIAATAPNLASTQQTVQHMSGTPVGTGSGNPPAVPLAQTFGGNLFGINPSPVTDDVNSGTGALQLSHTDLTVAGIGEPFTLTRNYNSADTTGGYFGPGWTSIFDASIKLSSSTVTTSTIATLRAPDGQQLVYNKPSCGNGTCVFTSPAGSRADLSCNKMLCTATTYGGISLTSNNGVITSYTGPSGKGLTFNYNKQNQLTGVTLTSANTPIYVTVTVVNGRIIQVSTPTRQVSYVYTGGVLTGFVDANGKTTSYAYNPNGSLLTGVTPPGDTGLALSVSYGAGGLVQTATSVASPQQLFADRYAYTGSAGTGTTTRTSSLDVGDSRTPTQVNYIDQHRGYAMQWEQAPDGGVTAYNYSPNYGVTAFQDPLGAVQTMTYDAVGNLLSQTDPAGGTVSYTYDPHHDVVTSTDPDGNTTGYVYTSPHVVSWQIPPDPAGPKNVPGPQGKDGTQSLYNNLGELIERKSPTSIETFTYDNAGNQAGFRYYNVLDTGLTTPLNGNGPLTLFDEAGDKTAVVQARGLGAGGSINPAFETISTYDADGNLLTTTKPGQGPSTTTYHPDGSVATVQNAGQTTATSYTWNPSSLTQTTTAGSVTSTSTYDPSGDQLNTSDAGSHTTTYTYDRNGRELSETTPDNVTTTYTYNTGGDALTSRDTVGHTGTFTWDADHRLIGSVTNGSTSTKQYDAAGNLVSATTSGATTTYTFNDRNLMASVTNSAGTTGYGYDLSGNLVSVTDGNGNVTGYSYNGAGERTSTVVAGNTWTYSYDADLNQISSTDPDGRVTAKTLDAQDNVTQITYSQAGQPTITENQTFNSAGQKLAVSNASGTDSYTYNSSGQLTQETGPGAGFTYSYRAGGFSETYPQTNGSTGGTNVNYTLDDAGNVMTITAPTAGVNVSYLRNDARQITGVVLGNGLMESDSYNQQGEVVSQNLSCATDNGIQNMGSAQYAYDAQGEPTNGLSTIGGSTTTSAYGYDGTGEVNAQSATTAANTNPTSGCTSGSSFPAGSPNNGSDASGTTSGAPAPNQNVPSPASQAGLTSSPTSANPITYDHVGNRTAANGVTYTYNGANELTAGNNGSTSTYDKAGDLVSTTVNGQTTTYSYNAADQLVGVAEPNGTVIGYTYDPNGNRLTKSVNGPVVDNYYWDQSGTSPLLAMEVDGRGNLIAEYFYGAGPVAMNTTAGTYYYLTDARGDVTQLTNATGAIVANYLYDAFGNLLPASSTAGAPDNPILLEGEYLDASTGLYNLRARQYDATTGRFTQPDAVRPLIGTPVVSPYVFAGNQPTASGDPSGNTAAGSFVQNLFVPTGHSTEATNTVAQAKIDTALSNLTAKGSIKAGLNMADMSVSETEAVRGASTDAGRALGVVGLGLGAYVTYEDCTNDGPGSLECIGDIAGLVISTGCLAVTDGLGSVACGAAAFLGPVIIEDFGPQIAAFVTSAYEYLQSGLLSCGTGPSAACIGATVGVAVAVACEVVTAGAGSIGCEALGGALEYVLTSYGPAIAAGLAYAGDQVASGFDKLGSYFSSGYHSAVATLAEAGYDSLQLGRTLLADYEIGAQDELDELVALGYDADGVAKTLEGVYDEAPAEVGRLMGEAGYAGGQIADGLKAAFNYKATQAAAVLAELGLHPDQVAGALESAYANTITSLEDLASVLAAVNYDPGAIASELKSFGESLNLDETTIFNESVQALSQHVGYLVDEVFSAMEPGGLALYGDLVTVGNNISAEFTNIYGESVPLAEHLAQSLEDVYNATAAEVATAIKGAFTTDVLDVVTQALKYIDLDDSAVAGVLEGLGFNPTQVAQELQTWFDDSGAQVISILKSVFPSVTASQLAGILQNQFNETTSEVENALKPYFSNSEIDAIGGAFSNFGSSVVSTGKTVVHYLNPLNW
jgi:RHS repeat-associated protein